MKRYILAAIILILITFYVIGFIKNYDACKTTAKEERSMIEESMDYEVKNGNIKAEDVAVEKERINSYIDNNFKICVKKYFSFKIF